MSNLDNIDAIKKLDKEDILTNMQEWPSQIEKCWADWANIAIPTSFVNTKNVLILGLGGSGIGAALIASLARKECPLVVEVSRDYTIPAWVDKNTLVIAVSYSGYTEETLSAFKAATAKTDKLITISTGGSLASIGSNHKALHYEVKYSSQPRQALGYSLTSLLAIFSKLRLLEIKSSDIEEALILLKGFLKKVDVDIPVYRNQAKILAQKLVNRIPVILAADPLTEVARRWKQHLNEDAKTTSYFEEIPEMNHNALVGLEFPENLGQKIFVFILESRYNHPRNKLRQNVMTQIFTQRRIPCETVMLEPAGSILAEILQMILLGDYIAFYLAVLNNVAPEPVEVINFLKDRLSEADSLKQTTK